MPLPNFLCVGAQKSGTTTLHDILVQHPNIYLPEVKETKFFQRDDYYNRGIIFYENSFFSKWKGQKAIGEIDPSYMFFEYVPERIYKYLGENIKLIFMLRNPIYRAYSHYLMSYKMGLETESFEKAIKLVDEYRQQNDLTEIRFRYISRGYYATQIKRFLMFFPIENMFFIIFEDDFLKRREQTISEVLDFLQVENIELLNLNIKSNSASIARMKFIRNFIHKPNIIKQIGKILICNKDLRKNILMYLNQINNKPVKHKELDSNLKKFLMENYFFKEIKALENIINRDLNIWYKI